MPIFNKNTNTRTAATTDYPAGNTLGHGAGGPLHPGTAFTTGPGHTGMNQPAYHTGGAPYGNTTGGYGHGTVDPAQPDTYGHADPYSSAGVGHGPATTGIPPTGAITDPNYPRQGGAGQRITGKVESALGSIVCSDTLKAKGLQKQQEANALNMQARELTEAERLEREAKMRRDRAVAHGAHPTHKELGSGLR